MRALFVIILLMSSAASTVNKNVYFPRHAFGDNGDQFAANYYGTWLSFFKESSLLKETSEGATKETYRFLWLRTFHHAIVIRMDVAKDGTGNLVTKVASGEAGFGTRNQKILEDTSRQLSRMETQSLLRNLNGAGFWSIQGGEAAEITGNDGSEWVIEGEKDGHYHVVARWSPCSAYRQLLSLYHRRQICWIGRAWASDLARLNIPNNEVY
jgi:hypothetical protein